MTTDRTAANNPSNVVLVDREKNVLSRHYSIVKRNTSMLTIELREIYILLISVNVHDRVILHTN